jgi:hypothetical protein
MSVNFAEIIAKAEEWGAELEKVLPELEAVVALIPAIAQYKSLLVEGGVIVNDVLAILKAL